MNLETSEFFLKQLEKFEYRIGCGVGRSTVLPAYFLNKEIFSLDSDPR